MTLRRMYKWSVASMINKPVPERVFQIHESSKGEKGYAVDPEFYEYLASINLGAKTQYDFELKTMPALAGLTRKLSSPNTICPPDPTASLMRPCPMRKGWSGIPTLPRELSAAWIREQAK